MTEQPTPVYHETATSWGAKSFVRRQMDGVEADAAFNTATRQWTPVARLRSDQSWLRDRLEERGVKCILNTDSGSHVSAAMVDAGADALLRGQRLGLDGRDVARMVYEEMEKCK